MSEVSRMQRQYGCSYSSAYKTENIVEYITQTAGELLKILEKQDREELERYWIKYFSEKPIVTTQKEGGYV